jgi:hypothetical protein
MSESAPTDPAADLAVRARALRVRPGSVNLDRILLVIGGVLLPLGLLLIVLAWLGASHTVLLFEQIPYMISGGLLGLALVFIGGFIYFTYWQTLLVREGRDQSRRVEELLVRIESHLASAADQAEPPSLPSRARSTTASPRLLATPTGTMLHRSTCQVVAGRSELRRVTLGTAGFEPCRLCRPDQESAG